MTTIFFSYSHKDEGLRDELEAHLSPMKRDGTIEAWHDRRITAGDDFKGKINAAIEISDIVLLLVSADFLASDYCIDVEMERALERHNRGQTRIIPIILRPCVWQTSAFGQFLVAPKDGKPVTLWPDRDEALANVAAMIAASLPKGQRRSSGTNLSPTPTTDPVVRSSNLRIAKKFTQAEREGFAVEAFEFMARYFEGSLKEIGARNSGIEGRFRRLDANKFTAVIYADGVARARCKISFGGMAGSDSIGYSNNDQSSDNSLNDWLRAEADAQHIYMKGAGFNLGGHVNDKLTFEGAAEYFWTKFIEPLQR